MMSIKCGEKSVILSGSLGEINDYLQNIPKEMQKMTTADFFNHIQQKQDVEKDDFVLEDR